MRCNALLILLLLVAAVVNGQSVSKKEAINLFNDKEYKEAYQAFKQLYKKKNTNVEYNYYLGVCLLELNLKPSFAAKCLRFVKDEKPTYSEDIDLLLGRALHSSMNFSMAIKYYQAYKQDKSLNIQRDINKLIDNCQNGAALMKQSVDVDMEHLSKRVNTSHNEMLPFATLNEDRLVFASDKPNSGVHCDLYQSSVKKGRYQRASSLGKTINTEWNDEVTYLSTDGKLMISTFDNFGETNLRISELLPDGSYSSGTRFGDTINTIYNERSATLNHDGTMMVFSSDRPGGFGGYDLYTSRLLPTGEWGEPVNMGPVVNTDGNEISPVLTDSSNVLFFASTGHLSMGGYDLFKSIFDPWEQKWSMPSNLGYPVNTPFDDNSISFNENRRNAYVSQIRDEGLGGYDVYRVTFNSNEPRYTVITGLLSADSAILSLFDTYKEKIDGLRKEKEKLVASNGSMADILEINDKLKRFVSKANFVNPAMVTEMRVEQNNELVGVYRPNPETSKYVIILPPGKYSLYIEHQGYEPLQKEINVYDKSSYQFMREQNFVLHQKATASIKRN